VPVIACACYACMTSVHYIIIVNDVKTRIYVWRLTRTTQHMVASGRDLDHFKQF
jgi:hypothetical protein